MIVTRNRWIGLAAILIATTALAFFVGRSSTPTASHRTIDVPAADVWTCSMHPQIQLPEPGACPLCGMDLIPVATASDTDAGPRSITLSPSAQAMAEVQTSPVTRRATSSALQLVGKIEADESRVKEVAARVDGRVDKLHVGETGVTVAAGAPLFDLYSPKLYAAQQELTQAVAAVRDLEQSTLEITRRSATRTVDAARVKLRLWGLTASQIANIEAHDRPSEHITVVSPIDGTVIDKNIVEGTYVKTGSHLYTIASLDRLWVQLDLYESDLGWVALGQTVTFTADAFPGEEFAGRISFIDPVLEAGSRTVRARVEVDNADGRLKPGMFARATVRADTPSTRDMPLLIPKTAPLRTGKRAVVYVADTDTPGRYTGREVVLGATAGDAVIVESGLREGELVVVNGAFKIDSALQILAKPSMMNPVDDQPGHPSDGKSAPEPLSAPDVPIAFRVGLDPVLTAYFAVGDALSHDDLPAAQRAAETLPDAVRLPDSALLPLGSRGTWENAQQALTHSSRAVVDAADLATARHAFFDLSASAIETVKQFGGSDSRPVLLYHCPMARDGQGADWLQQKPGTENPYYGSAMFSCGSQTAVLIEGGAQ